jgi:hypothetical protein
MSLVTEWLEIGGWTILSLVICAVFDMGAKFRIENSYTNPRAPLEPTFFSGFTARHIPLIGFGLVMPYNLRNHIREISPSVVLVGVFLLTYGILLGRDVLRRVRQALEAARP